MSNYSVPEQSENKTLKITLTSWAPFIGGAEVAVERLALGLAEEEHDVLLVVGTEGEALERFRGAGIRCEFIPQRFTDKLKWLQYRKSRNQLVELLKREKPDLVHSNDLTTHQLTADSAGRLGIPRVCHHRWIFEKSAIDWLNKFGAEHHLFVSDALMQQLISESELLEKSSRKVVYDGLPLPEVPNENDKADSRKRLDIPGDKTIVLFAGQIIERKGVADLIHAWAELDETTRAKSELYICGDDLAGEGAYLREMKSLAETLTMAIHFMGFQKNVDEWITAADIVTVPSHAEPLGNATLEAMALARPVIGGDVGGIPEMIVAGETGLLVPPKNPKQLAAALTQLILNSQQAEELGRNARMRCETKFSLGTHVDNVLKEYESVLS